MDTRALEGKTVALRDGSIVTVRAMVKEDKRTVTPSADPGGRSLLPQLLVEVDGRIVADAPLHQCKLGWMANVAGVRVIVSPTHRNKGLAVRSVRGLIQIAQNSGMNKLETEFIP